MTRILIELIAMWAVGFISIVAFVNYLAKK